MNVKMFKLYEALQEEISKFSMMKYQTEEAKIGQQGIIKGLEIALEKIIEIDSK